MSFPLIFVHLGLPEKSSLIPEYLFDSVYQAMLLNENIHILAHPDAFDGLQKTISKFNIHMFSKLKHNISLVDITALDQLIESKYNAFINKIKSANNIDFRDGFWMFTIKRFLYINTYISKHNLSNVFHIENDVMLYNSVKNIYENIIHKENIYLVKDSPNRVIPSIVFLPNPTAVQHMISFITSQDVFTNDMEILGKYINTFGTVKSFATEPFQKGKNTSIFDGACLGQYLGGIDHRNIVNSQENHPGYIIEVYNKTSGFINETSTLKANKYIFVSKKIISEHLHVPLAVTVIKNTHESFLENNIFINNLHIHSKQLNMFSSVNLLRYNNIISGDRVMGSVDIVITTPEILAFHKNIRQFNKNIFETLDFKLDSSQLDQFYMKLNSIKFTKNRYHISIGLYTHTLSQFITYLLPSLEKYSIVHNVSFVYYIHNSDHVFDNSYMSLVNGKSTQKIYAQNLNIVHEKCELLPIGIANSMWNHGDIMAVYTANKAVYKYLKTKDLYININVNTFKYRQKVYDYCKENKFEISSSVPFAEYISDLAKYRFCLCIRGNGIDTHRFWESLYLGVIPILISNSETQCENFIKNLERQDIPFIKLREPSDLSKFKFNNKLYSQIIKKTPFNEALYLEYYF
jgi:hypothetical protein